MSRILIFSDQFPIDLSSGRYLRVNHLCRELSTRYQCFIVDLAGQEREAIEIESLGCEEGRSLQPIPAERRSFRRHFRLSNEEYLRLSSPDYCEEIITKIGLLIEEWDIEMIVNFSAERAELLVDADLPKLLDYTDCDTLTIERVLAQRGAGMPLREKAATRLQLLRQSRMERSILKAFDVTTTIAEPDRKRMLELSGIGDERIVVVPNGVSQEAHEIGGQDFPHDKSLVFWGNLNFAPNWTAVRFFYDEVFLPYLAKSGLVWHIFGGGAGPEIADVLKHPQVRAEGFKDKLFEHVAGCGVMVNPMVEGSGLKNKVLEAFAVGLPVVSTTLGVEGLDVSSGYHCRVSDRPADFASDIRKLLAAGRETQQMIDAARKLAIGTYSWTHVGAAFASLVEEILGQKQNA